VEQRRFGLAHLLGHGTVADRLPRLLLQGIHLAGQLPDHILEPQ
jgi:hypothetical protein